MLSRKPWLLLLLSPIEFISIYGCVCIKYTLTTVRDAATRKNKLLSKRRTRGNTDLCKYLAPTELYLSLSLSLSLSLFLTLALAQLYRDSSRSSPLPYEGEEDALLSLFACAYILCTVAYGQIYDYLFSPSTSSILLGMTLLHKYIINGASGKLASFFWFITYNLGLYDGFFDDTTTTKLKMGSKVYC